ncbi:hypothetical protein H1C71_008315 [Ictidomys tridecemlineatus]|nr:hypothetical protein H1C71_008315 [Ictidomys tridecemlineatus]
MADALWDRARAAKGTKSIPLASLDLRPPAGRVLLREISFAPERHGGEEAPASHGGSVGLGSLEGTEPGSSLEELRLVAASSSSLPGLAQAGSGLRALLSHWQSAPLLPFLPVWLRTRGSCCHHRTLGTGRNHKNPAALSRKMSPGHAHSGMKKKVYRVA